MDAIEPAETIRRITQKVVDDEVQLLINVTAELIHCLAQEGIFRTGVRKCKTFDNANKIVEAFRKQGYKCYKWCEDGTGRFEIRWDITDDA